MITESLDNYSIHSEHAIEEARKTGQKVVLPAHNELFVDIDTEENYQLFLTQMEKFRQFWIITYTETESKSGLPRRHIVVRLPFHVDDTERIAFQAALGSDPVRELLGLIRVQNCDPHPTLFLEKADV